MAIQQDGAVVLDTMQKCELVEMNCENGLAVSSTYVVSYVYFSRILLLFLRISAPWNGELKLLNFSKKQPPVIKSCPFSLLCRCPHRGTFS